MSGTPVFMEVPQPLYDVDAELNLMSMLEYVMRSSNEVLTSEEQERVATWFSGRYCHDGIEKE